MVTFRIAVPTGNEFFFFLFSIYSMLNGLSCALFIRYGVYPRKYVLYGRNVHSKIGSGCFRNSFVSLSIDLLIRNFSF